MQIEQILFEAQALQTLSPDQARHLAHAVLDNSRWNPQVWYLLDSNIGEPGTFKVSYWREETAEEVRIREAQEAQRAENQKVLELSQLAILADKYPEAGYRRVKV